MANIDLAYDAENFVQRTAKHRISSPETLFPGFFFQVVLSSHVTD